MDPHPYRVLSLGWSNEHDFHGGRSKHRLRCALTGPPDDATRVYNSLRVATSHFVKHWEEVSWNPLASYGEAWLEQHFRITDTFSGDGDGVSV